MIKCVILCFFINCFYSSIASSWNCNVLQRYKYYLKYPPLRLKIFVKKQVFDKDTRDNLTFFTFFPSNNANFV